MARQDNQRRSFLAGLGRAIGATVWSTFQGMAGLNPFGAVAYAAGTEIAKEEWLAAWLRVTPREVDGSLILFRFKDPTYVLTKPISWMPNVNRTGQFDQVDVPKGFVTDLASIPRAFFTLLRPDGEYAYAAIVHDYLYWTQTTSREVADEILRLGMEDFAVDPRVIGVIYRAVRSFGSSAWTSNAKLKAGGERRLLAKTPDDPRITWAEWKQRPDVFAP